MEKVLSNSTLSINDILEEAETLVNPEKKDYLENLKFLFDDQNSMDKKMQSLIEFQKGQSLLRHSQYLSPETE